MQFAGSLRSDRSAQMRKQGGGAGGSRVHRNCVLALLMGRLCDTGRRGAVHNKCGLSQQDASWSRKLSSGSMRVLWVLNKDFSPDVETHDVWQRFHVCDRDYQMGEGFMPPIVIVNRAARRSSPVPPLSLRSLEAGMSFTKKELHPLKHWRASPGLLAERAVSFNKK